MTDQVNHVVKALQVAAGDVPDNAVRLRGYLAERAATGLSMVSVPLLAQSFGASNMRHATLHIRRNTLRTLRAHEASGDLAGALILDAEVCREHDKVDVRVVYVDAEDVAQLA